MIVECLRQLRSGPMLISKIRPLGLEDLVCVLMTYARSTCKPLPTPGPITKDLLRE